MSHVRVCECCGKNLDIDDKDNLEPINNLVDLEQDHKHDVAVCAQCTCSQPVDKV